MKACWKKLLFMTSRRMKFGKKLRIQPESTSIELPLQTPRVETWMVPNQPTIWLHLHPLYAIGSQTRQNIVFMNGYIYMLETQLKSVQRRLGPAWQSTLTFMEALTGKAMYSSIWKGPVCINHKFQAGSIELYLSISPGKASPSFDRGYLPFSPDTITSFSHFSWILCSGPHHQILRHGGPRNYCGTTVSMVEIHCIMHELKSPNMYVNYFESIIVLVNNSISQQQMVSYR